MTFKTNSDKIVLTFSTSDGVRSKQTGLPKQSIRPCFGANGSRCLREPFSRPSRAVLAPCESRSRALRKPFSLPSRAVLVTPMLSSKYKVLQLTTLSPATHRMKSCNSQHRVTFPDSTGKDNAKLNVPMYHCTITLFRFCTLRREKFVVLIAIYFVFRSLGMVLLPDAEMGEDIA